LPQLQPFYFFFVYKSELANQFMHLLIQKAKQQDRLAQKQLYDQYAASLLSVCRLYISDAHFAEDVLLRAFFKILTHIDSYQEQEHFYAWMRRITVNECIDFLRSKTQKVVLADWNDTYDSIDDTDLDSYAFEESQTTTKGTCLCG